MNTAIVGYGKMGKFYNDLINAKYIIDVMPVQNRCYFSNIDEFIAYGQPVDLVIISSLTTTHFTIAKKLLLSGYNVLCEKPICLTKIEAQALEKIAIDNNLLLYQSTLERYNPLIKFIKNNISINQVKKVVSSRYGIKPHFSTNNDAMFDLGIHDLDLWFYLFNQKVLWELNVKYTRSPKREIVINLKNGQIIALDLLHKYITFNNSTLDFNKASQNNPMLEMIYSIEYKKQKMNELWSKEIEILEKNSNKSKILLNPFNNY